MPGLLKLSNQNGLDLSTIQDKVNKMQLDMLRSGTEITPNDFKSLKMIGKGGYGKVFQVRKLSGADKGKIYAMKAVLKSKVKRHSEDINHIIAEKNILKEMDCPFIVQLHYSFQTEEKLYLVMELLRGGDLFFHMEKSGTFSEPVAQFYLAEIVLALEHLHTHNVVYRDLKPDNIVLDHYGHVKLTDFGLCKPNLVGDELTHTFCGTVEYMAPETIRKKGHGKSVDFWSLGIMMYDMLHGNVPFHGATRRELLENILKEKLPMSKVITEEAKDLLRRLLTRNVKKRITCEEIKSHSFFETVDWNKMLALEMQPPFVPTFRSDEDVSYFMKEFTDQPIEKEDFQPVSESEDENVFAGFSYTSPLHMSANLSKYEQNSEDRENLS